MMRQRLRTVYLMESADVSEAVKAELLRRKNSLDLQQLLETTHTLQSKLISMAEALVIDSYG